MHRNGGTKVSKHMKAQKHGGTATTTTTTYGTVTSTGGTQQQQQVPKSKSMIGMHLKSARDLANRGMKMMRLVRHARSGCRVTREVSLSSLHATGMLVLRYVLLGTE